MYLYPIKSCGAQEVHAWPVGPHGLLLDREWALLDDEGKVLTQKGCPAAARVSATVDLAAATLTLSVSEGPDPLIIRIPGLITPGHVSRHAEKDGSMHAAATVGECSRPSTPSSITSGSSSDCSSSTAAPSTSTSSASGRSGSSASSSAGRSRDESSTGDGSSKQTVVSDALEIMVCGDRTCSSVVGEEVVIGSQTQGSCRGDRGSAAVRAWFSAAIGVPCRLVRASQCGRTARSGTTGLGTQAQQQGSRAAGNTTSLGTEAEATAAGAASPTPAVRDTAAAGRAPGVGFANDGQFLLVNAASVQDVNSRILALRGAEASTRSTATAAGSGSGSASASGEGTSGAALSPGAGAAAEGTAGTAVKSAGAQQSDETAPGNGTDEPAVELLRFRPNLVVSGLPAYAEDAWTSKVQVGPLACQVLGTCPRCEMLQVDQKTGVRGRADVLMALAQYRRLNGRMHFGILLAQAAGGRHGGGRDAAGAAAVGSAREAGEGARVPGGVAGHEQQAEGRTAVDGDGGCMGTSKTDAGRQLVGWMRATFGTVLCVGDEVCGDC